MTGPVKSIVMRILGIDPGTVAMGYGVIDDRNGEVFMVDCGVITAPARASIGERLSFLYRHLVEIITRHGPDVVAVEQPFLAKNVKSAIAIGQAQAIAMLAASNQNIAVHGYTPTQVKQKVANYGNSSKEQVQEMVRLHLGLTEVPRPSDVSDALAVALCHRSETHLTSLLARQKER